MVGPKIFYFFIICLLLPLSIANPHKKILLDHQNVSPAQLNEMIGTLDEFSKTTQKPNQAGDVLHGKIVSNFLKNWMAPNILWDLLNFPTVPNSEESLLLATLEAPTPDTPDVSLYNLGLYEGLVDGTLPCDCGRPFGRVVNGKAANINNIPWTSAIAHKNAEQPFCGATLINNKYLVTAAHCVRSTKPSEIQVWLNDENYLLSNETVGGRLVYDVVEIKKHSEYKAYFNDIALLKVNGTIKLGEEFVLVNPVCLPVEAENDYAGYTGTVAGWGKTSANGQVSPALLKINIPIWSNDECRRESKYKESVRDNMMCAGFKEGGTDACQGDSGGPLIIRQNVTTYTSDDADDEGTAVLVGIVSWGFGCAEPKAPGVYTRFNLYTKWILENTQDAQYCQVYSKRKY